MAKAVGEIKTDKGKMVKGNFVSLREVARRVEVHPQTILRWLKSKKVTNVIPYKDFRKRWMFPEKDVQKFIDYKQQFEEVNAK